MNKEPTRARDLQTGTHAMKATVTAQVREAFTEMDAHAAPEAQPIRAENKAVLSAANKIFKLLHLPPLPKLEPVNVPVYGFSAAFLRQIEAEMGAAKALENNDRRET